MVVFGDGEGQTDLVMLQHDGAALKGLLRGLDFVGSDGRGLGIGDAASEGEFAEEVVGVLRLFFFFGGGDALGDADGGGKGGEEEGEHLGVWDGGGVGWRVGFEGFNSMGGG